jgi:hypothetical protein
MTGGKMLDNGYLSLGAVHAQCSFTPVRGVQILPNPLADGVHPKFRTPFYPGGTVMVSAGAGETGSRA